MIALFLFATLHARAELDPLTGARVSLVGTQKLLAAPFLPTMDGGRARVGVQASYMTAHLGGTPERYATYTGDFTGLSAGFGISPPLRDGYGYYLNGMLMQMSGQVHVEGDPNAPSFTTIGLVAWTGLSARVIGRDASTFALGIFAGPSLMHVSSSLGAGDGAITSRPDLLGVTAGVQVVLKLGRAVANPYALLSQNVYGDCVSLDAPGEVNVPDGCGGRANAIRLHPSFAAFGLILGYGDFALNVYSKLTNHAELHDVLPQNYAVSYSF